MGVDFFSRTKQNSDPVAHTVKGEIQGYMSDTKGQVQGYNGGKRLQKVITGGAEGTNQWGAERLSGSRCCRIQCDPRAGL